MMWPATDKSAPLARTDPLRGRHGARSYRAPEGAALDQIALPGDTERLRIEHYTGARAPTVRRHERVSNPRRFSLAHGVSTGVRVLGTVSALCLVASCYSRRTADEELVDFTPRAASPADAGSSPVLADAGLVDSGVRPVVDAGATRCTGTDPISVLLCSLTMPRAGTGTTTTPTSTGGLTDLIGLLDSAGGLESIAAVLGAFTGTGTTGSATTQPSLTDLINLAGGLGNIATLLNGLSGSTQPGTTPTRAATNNPIADLIAAFAQTPSASGATPSMAGAPASLIDWLAALGLSQPKSLGSAATSPVPTPSAADCTAPADAATSFVCQLQAARAASSLAP